MYRLGFLLLIFGLVQCSLDSKSGRYGNYSDNLEDLRGNGNKIKGRLDSFSVGDLPQIQRDTVKSGKNAIKLTPSFPYGLNYTIPDVSTDEYIEASVWYSGPGQLVLVASHKDANFFYRKTASIESGGSEWRQLKINISVPPSMNKEDLHIYVWNPGKETVYVDDFKITYKEYKSYPEYDMENSIHLMIDTMDMILLEQKRNEAFSKGILETEDDDYVPGIMYYNDSIMPVDIRLKGDWLDHLEGRKWSFRIKMKKQNTWKNVRAFSIHTPVARDFLNEYVSHEVYRDADLLSPRYGFVPVTLNGTSLGIYAWEEHFEKQMIESMNRREGPILKFDESLFWQSQKVFVQDTQYFEFPFLEAADIVPFKLNRTLKDTTLRDNFLIAHNLMNQYRFGLRSVSEIFDIKKVAGYFALMDLTRGFHGETWHNQRHYYNPVICRLEPIFFDAYTEAGVFNPENNAVSGLFNFDPKPEKRFENLFWVKLFQDSLFVKEYISWLDLVSDPLWINNFFQVHSDKINRYEKLIQEEFNDYAYDRGFILENARKIRNELPLYKEIIATNPGYAKFNPDSLKYLKYTNEFDPRFPEYYVNAYLSDYSADEYSIHVDNFFPIEVNLLGYGESAKIMEKELVKTVELPAFINRLPQHITINVPSGSKYLFFKVSGFEERFVTEIVTFPEAKDFSPEQELFIGADVPDLDCIRRDGESIHFLKGDFKITEPLVLPPGFQVIFEAGCNLDFVNQSFFISKSPVDMKGEPDSQVIIKSSDKTARGFTTLQAGRKSYLKNVIFNGFNTLDYKGWKLTGAVNFYESDVEISDVKFQDNVCEDALNIIRSEFRVNNSSFTNIYADAFDSDFCTGIVENVEFNMIGNDAIDFSGSQVEIKECSIKGIGDKGVSAGENSSLTVSSTVVEDANIAFASKDLSSLTLNNCEARKVNYGLLAFQKKPEYGPASIRTTGFNADGAGTLFLIERISKLNLNGTIIQGNSTSLAKMFY